MLLLTVIVLVFVLNIVDKSEAKGHGQIKLRRFRYDNCSDYGRTCDLYFDNITIVGGYGNETKIENTKAPDNTNDVNLTQLIPNATTIRLATNGSVTISMEIWDNVTSPSDLILKIDNEYVDFVTIAQVDSDNWKSKTYNYDIAHLTIDYQITSCDAHFTGPGCNFCESRKTGEDCKQCVPGRTGEDCGQCAHDYHGTDCSVHCLAVQGQYSCSANGTKVCESRWAGATCDICASHWTGANCDRLAPLVMHVLIAGGVAVFVVMAVVTAAACLLRRSLKKQAVLEQMIQQESGSVEMGRNTAEISASSQQENVINKDPDYPTTLEDEDPQYVDNTIVGITPDKTLMKQESKQTRRSINKSWILKKKTALEQNMIQHRCMNVEISNTTTSPQEHHSNTTAPLLQQGKMLKQKKNKTKRDEEKRSPPNAQAGSQQVTKLNQTRNALIGNLTAELTQRKQTHKMEQAQGGPGRPKHAQGGTGSPKHVHKMQQARGGPGRPRQAHKMKQAQSGPGRPKQGQGHANSTKEEDNNMYVDNTIVESTQLEQSGSEDESYYATLPD